MDQNNFIQLLSDLRENAQDTRDYAATAAYDNAIKTCRSLFETKPAEEAAEDFIGKMLGYAEYGDEIGYGGVAAAYRDIAEIADPLLVF